AARGPGQPMRAFPKIVALAGGFTALAGHAETLELYVDTTTSQVYAEPGPNRVRLGVFERVDETGRGESDATVAARAPAASEVESASSASTVAPARRDADRGAAATVELPER